MVEEEEREVEEVEEREVEEERGVGVEEREVEEVEWKAEEREVEEERGVGVEERKVEKELVGSRRKTNGRRKVRNNCVAELNEILASKVVSC